MSTQTTAAPLDRDFGLTPELLRFVRDEEGLVLTPYLCPAGCPTIGYGHRIPSMDHASITKDQAETMLRADLRRFRDAALSLSPSLRTASPRRMAAILDFCFNAGEGAYKTSTLRKRVDAGDWAAAATEIRRWVYATVNGQKVRLRALVERREMTARWLAEG